MGIDFSQAQETRVIARGKITFDATGITSKVINIKDCTANSIVVFSAVDADAAAVVGSATGIYCAPAAGKITFTFPATAATIELAYVVYEN